MRWPEEVPLAGQPVNYWSGGRTVCDAAFEAFGQSFGVEEGHSGAKYDELVTAGTRNGVTRAGLHG